MHTTVCGFLRALWVYLPVGLAFNPQGKGSMPYTRCLMQACHLAGALVLVAAPAAAFTLRQYPVERQEAAGLWLIKLSSG